MVATILTKGITKVIDCIFGILDVVKRNIPSFYSSAEQSIRRALRIYYKVMKTEPAVAHDKFYCEELPSISRVDRQTSTVPLA